MRYPLGVGAPQRCVGFVPGDLESVAISRDLNRIPLKDDFRPDDQFRLHHRVRHPAHKRPHLPNAPVHGPTEMRPKWLSERQAMEAEVTSGAGPTDGGGGGGRGDEVRL